MPTKSREQSRSIFIMISNTKTFLNNAIGLYTNIPYNHVSISFKKDLNHMYSFARKNPRNPLIGGFVREDMETRFFNYFPHTRCIVLELKVTDDQYLVVKRTVRQFEQNQEKYRYNLVGLFTIPFRRPLNRENAYFCSQFVAEVLKRADVKLFDKSCALVTPKDFWYLVHGRQADLIYEGDLVHYPYQRKVKVG